MKVLDLRPLAVRLWHARGGSGAPDPGPLARLTGAVGDALVQRRVAGRDEPWPDLAVVSVGNLACGGTGKTPVVAALARDLAAAGWTGGVLTRGYRSRLPGPLLVDRANEGAGDEARLLAAALAPLGWPVVQARRRHAGMPLLAAALPAGSVVLLEDGHQTARLGRHLDIVILDRWTRSADRVDGLLLPAAGPVVPLGPWRESAAGAGRAGIWLVEAEQPPAAGVGGRAVAGFVRELTLQAPDGSPLEVPLDRPWAALSGIAHPARFEAGAAAVAGGPPVLAVRCADHAAYGRHLRSRVAAAVRAAGTPLTVTTEKDWIKLRRDWPRDLPVVLARLRLRWTGARALPDLVGERLASIAPEGR